MDCATDAPSVVSNAKESNATLMKWLNDLKVWQETQLDQLKQSQEASRTQIEADEMRMQKLLQRQKCRTSGDESSKVKKVEDSKPQKFVGESTATTAPTLSTKDIYQTKVKRVEPVVIVCSTLQGNVEHSVMEPENADEIVPVLKKAETERKDGSTSAISVTSFETAIDRQCLKLQGSNEDHSTHGKPKVKFPFLKKGTGLGRFLSKPIQYPEEKRRCACKATKKKKDSPIELKGKLKLKPAIRKAVSAQTVPKSVNFCEEEMPRNKVVAKSCPILPEATGNLPTHDLYRSDPRPSPETHSESSALSPRSKESKELAQFVALEDFAQNSSFNSDSSYVNHIFDTYPSQTTSKVSESHVKDEKNKRPESIRTYQSQENSNEPSSLINDDYLSQLKTERTMLQQRLMNLKQSNAALEIGDNMHQEKQNDVIDLTSSEDESHNQHSHEIKKLGHKKNKSRLQKVSDCSSASISTVSETTLINAGSDVSSVSYEEICEKEAKGRTISSSTILRGKLDELEQEIATYKTETMALQNLQKKRDFELTQLQKEREEFRKHRETELSKLEKEIKEQKMQMRREKESFERYQRLRKDNPTQKEKAEISYLRKQNEALQQEMQTKTGRWELERRQLKRKITAIEKEKDFLKMENERLEEQVFDLNNSLKVAQRKLLDATTTNPSHVLKDTLNLSRKTTRSNTDLAARKLCDQIPGKDSENVLPSTSDISKEYEPSVKPHVHFNLEPEVKRYTLDGRLLSYKETVTDTETKRLYENGETEIIFPTGTKKWISADGLHTKMLYYNGDTKEMFPDHKTVYKYADGTTETNYPDGLHIAEFPDKQIEKHYPDGVKEVLIPHVSGFIRIIHHNNGMVETRIPDGHIMKQHPDNTKVIEYPNGEKDVTTDDFQKHYFTDGTIKTIYRSGRQVTEYPDGRVKTKDKDGNVVIEPRNLYTTR